MRLTIALLALTIAAIALGVMIAVAAITPDPAGATQTPPFGASAGATGEPSPPPPEIPAGFSETPSPRRGNPCGSFIPELLLLRDYRECWYPPPQPVRCDGVERITIRFDADTYRSDWDARMFDQPRLAHGLGDNRVTFSAPYEQYGPCATRERLLAPGTRMRLVRDYDDLAHPDGPYSGGTRGQYEDWLYPNGIDPATGYPQYLIQGGAPTDWPHQIAGCAGIDFFPHEIRLVLAQFSLFGPHRRVAGEIVSERDDWRIEVSFGPLPDGLYGDPYRCNADPEGSGVAR